MKIFSEKLALAANVFLPVIVLVLVCSSYFYTSDKEMNKDPQDNEQVIKNESQLPAFHPTEFKNGEKQPG